MLTTVVNELKIRQGGFVMSKKMTTLDFLLRLREDAVEDNYIDLCDEAISQVKYLEELNRVMDHYFTNPNEMSLHEFLMKCKISYIKRNNKDYINYIRDEVKAFEKQISDAEDCISVGMPPAEILKFLGEKKASLKVYRDFLNEHSNEESND